MYPSSSLCRAQEAEQRARASGATLANIRTIAEKAAAAWGIEAALAEDRESRSERTRTTARAMLDQKRLTREEAMPAAYESLAIAEGDVF